MKTLVELFTDESTSTALILTEVRIAATRANLDEVETWAQKESEGYTEKDEVPDRRKIRVQIMCDVQAGFNFQMGVDLSTYVPSQFKEVLTHECRTGIKTIEEMVGKKKTAGMIAVMRPGLAAMVNTKYKTAERECQRATAMFPDTALREIVEKARQRALTFCLDCEKEGLTFLATSGEGEQPEKRDQYLKTLAAEALRTGAKEIWKRIIGEI